jgi:hypothetical protein
LHAVGKRIQLVAGTAVETRQVKHSESVND